MTWRRGWRPRRGRQGTAAESCHEEIIRERSESEPKRGRGRELGIPSPDPVEREERERDREDESTRGDMEENRLRRKPAEGSQDGEPKDERERQPVGDRHGEKVARGRVGHERRKHHQERNLRHADHRFKFNQHGLRPGCILGFRACVDGEGGGQPPSFVRISGWRC